MEQRGAIRDGGMKATAGATTKEVGDATTTTATDTPTGMITGTATGMAMMIKSPAL